LITKRFKKIIMSDSESDLLPSGDEEELRNVPAEGGGGSSEDDYSSSSSSGGK
jgi:hypothetical protein